MMMEQPELEHRLLQQTLNELDEARKWMVTLGRKTAAERVASFPLVVAHNVDPTQGSARQSAAFEARRAVADAMPFLFQARDVLVATLEEGDQKDARDSAEDVVLFLMKHGVNARAVVSCPGNRQIGEALAAMAREIGDRLRWLWPQPAARVGIWRRNAAASDGDHVASAILELTCRFQSILFPKMMYSAGWTRALPWQHRFQMAADPALS
jgi:hypothetical protein